MKRTILTSLFTLLVATMMFSCKPNDEKIQKEVQTVLSTVNSDVSSEVKDGVVTLKGIVASEEAKIALETTLKNVKDVKSVTNNIQVQAPVNPDLEMSNIVTTALTSGGFTSITADVKNGIITLTGDVKKSDLQKVLQIVHESKPLKVENQLKIN